jgi:hypothetical protein
MWHLAPADAREAREKMYTYFVYNKCFEVSSPESICEIYKQIQ